MSPFLGGEVIKDRGAGVVVLMAGYIDSYGCANSLFSETGLKRVLRPLGCKGQGQIGLGNK